MRVRIILIIVTVAILLGIFLPRVFRATDIPIATGSGDQRDFRIISDADGKAVIAWVSSTKAKTFLYAQRLDSKGRALWDKPVAVTSIVGNILEPKLAQSKGNIFVGWTRQKGNQLDVYIQKLSYKGDVLWRHTADILAAGPGDQRDLQLTADDNDGVYAAYTDFQTKGSHVRLQHLDAAGKRLWGAGKLADNSNAFSTSTFLLMLDKDLVVTWQQRKADFTTDIWAQRFDRQGRRLWSDKGQIVVDGPRQEEDIRLVSNGAGGLFAAWEDDRGPDRKVYAQHLDKKGVRLWPEKGVAVSTAKGAQWHPEISLFDGTDLIVVWKDMRVKEDDIYAQRISARGHLLWKPDGIPISIAKEDQSFFKITTAGKHVFIAWRDERGRDRDIYAQKIDGRGKSLWTKDGRVISQAKGNQQDPQITTINNKIFIIWSDFRNSEKEREIFGQTLLIGKQKNNNTVP